MAGSRLQKYGTIFTRVTGLLRSGAIPENGRPMWYDVYKTFPPNSEPNMFRPVPDAPIIDIIYPEDIIRARFYSTYGSPGLIDATHQLNKHKSLSQTFIEKYLEIAQRNDTLNDDQLFAATQLELLKMGINLRPQQLKTYRSDKQMDQNANVSVSSSSVSSIATSD